MPPDKPKFLVDTQLPPVLAAFLKRKGFDAIHTSSFPEGHLLSDGEIVVIATEENRIIVTKDSDFGDKFFLGKIKCGVLIIRLGNIKNADLIDFLNEKLTDIFQAFGTLGAKMVVLEKEQIILY